MYASCPSFFCFEISRRSHSNFLASTLGLLLLGSSCSITISGLLLGGPGTVLTGVIGRVSIIMIAVRVLISLLTTSPGPPSNHLTIGLVGVKVCGFAWRKAQGSNKSQG